MFSKTGSFIIWISLINIPQQNQILKFEDLPLGGDLDKKDVVEKICLTFS
jgi:hypothetical protein